MFFGWLVADGEIGVSPMLTVAKPIATAEAEPYRTEPDLPALLRLTRGM